MATTDQSEQQQTTKIGDEFKRQWQYSETLLFAAIFRHFFLSNLILKYAIISNY